MIQKVPKTYTASKPGWACAHLYVHPSMLNRSSSSPVTTGPLKGLNGPWLCQLRPLAPRTMPGAATVETDGAFPESPPLDVVDEAWAGVRDDVTA
jgi:hypothetical protein